jgi:hypothetical protein
MKIFLNLADVLAEYLLPNLDIVPYCGGASDLFGFEFRCVCLLSSFLAL